MIKQTTKFGGAILLLFLLATGSYFVSRNVVGLTPANSLTVTEILLSTILSFLLIVVYLSIRETNQSQLEEQKEQIAVQDSLAEIQRRQQKLMEANIAPEITVKAASANGDDIQIKCENKGKGVAKDLRVELDLFVTYERKHKAVHHVDDFEDDVDGTLHEIWYSLENPLISATRKNKIEFAQNGDSLQQGTVDSYVGQPRFWYSIGEVDGPRLAPVEKTTSYITEQLVDLDVVWLGYNLNIHFKNALDDEQEPIREFTGVVELNKKM